jgi:hypothetical protein
MAIQINSQQAAVFKTHFEALAVLLYPRVDANVRVQCEARRARVMIENVDRKMIGYLGLRTFGLQGSPAEPAARERGGTVSHASARRGRT